MVYRFSRFVAVLLLAASLSACGSKINQSNFDKVQNGMTKEEVAAILGSPTETSSINIGGLSGTASTWKSDSGEISIQFVNNRVQAKQFIKAGK
jgi:hypothetical protein